MAISNSSHVGKIIALPAVMLVLLGMSYILPAYEGVAWLPFVALFAVPIVLEQILRRTKQVSQRALLFRDVLSTIINLFITRAVVGAVLYPILVYFPERLLGRKLILASSDQLGPLWLQVIIVLLVISFARYWIHRLQHAVPVLWELHSYHHRTTDLQILNKYVSHPFDYALRNVVIFSVLYIVGFDDLVFFIAMPILIVAGAFDHCGADVNSGALNYVFVTPEVHRWHHSATTPDGFGYSCNYGVEFSFWDIVFGTYYLPKKNGVAEQPERIGYPGGGLPDEGSYLRSLLEPLGLYNPISRLTDGLKKRWQVAGGDD